MLRADDGLEKRIIPIKTKECHRYLLIRFLLCMDVPGFDILICTKTHTSCIYNLLFRKVRDYQFRKKNLKKFL